MNNLGELYMHIQSLPAPVPYVAVSVDVWDKIRDEVRYWCDDHDECFQCSPMPTPNFLVCGIPIIAAGHA